MSEKVVWEGRPDSKTFLVGRVFMAIFMVAAIALMCFEETIVGGVFLAVVVFIWFIASVLDQKHRLYQITPTHVSITTGRFSVNQVDYEISKIQSLAVTQNVVENFLGVGTLVIRTAANEGQIPFSGIKNPLEIKAKLQSMVRND